MKILWEHWWPFLLYFILLVVIISDPVSFLAAHSVSYLAAHHCNPPAQLSARLVNWFFDLFPFSCSPRPCFFLTAHHFLLGWSVHSPVGDSNPVECSKRWSQSTSTWAALPAEYFPSFFLCFFPARCSTNQWSSWKASSHSHLWNMWTSDMIWYDMCFLFLKTVRSAAARQSP